MVDPESHFQPKRFLTTHLADVEPFDIHIASVYDSSVDRRVAFMNRRINIVLPERTLTVLDRVAARGLRSRFIDRAVMRLVEVEGRQNLRARLKAEALANAERDLTIAAEWFPLEDEASRMSEESRQEKKPARTVRK